VLDLEPLQKLSTFHFRRMFPTSSASKRADPSRAVAPHAFHVVIVVNPSSDHCDGSNNPGGFVLFQGKEFLVAGHEELGLAGFS